MILIALRDIFHTLWHPRGFGTLSHVLFAITWRAVKFASRGSRSSVLAGPLGLLLTLSTWSLLLVVVFALLYLPRMPARLLLRLLVACRRSPRMCSRLCISPSVALTTLGLGDIQPATPLLRLLVPTQALLGFVLLTAGISWILQYPPPPTPRPRAGPAPGGGAGGAGDGGGGLAQYAESYYFRETDSDVSLAAALPYLAAARLCRRAVDIVRGAQARCSSTTAWPSSSSCCAGASSVTVGDVGGDHGRLRCGPSAAADPGPPLSRRGASRELLASN